MKKLQESLENAKDYPETLFNFQQKIQAAQEEIVKIVSKYDSSKVQD